MEKYHVDSVPKHQSKQTSFQLQERWKQWSGDSHSHSPYKFANGAADEAGFSCQSSIDNLEMDRVLCQRNPAEISCVQVDGLSDESSLYWSTLLNNQDYQLTGLSWMNQNDENFMNSLLADDVRFNEHFQFYNAPRCYSSFPMENNVANNDHLNAEDFPQLLDWEKNRSEALSYNCPDTMTSNTIPRYRTPVMNNQSPPRQGCSGGRVDNQLSVEETVLQDLGSATQKMSEESRRCFRDALYRLARNSEKYSRNRSKNGDRYIPETPLATASHDQTLRSSESEAKRNRIDRAVAEMMFNKAYLNEKSDEEIVSSVKKCTSGDSLRKLLATHFQQFSRPALEEY